MSRACLDCLTRARLLEALAPRIERLAGRERQGVRELLARDDDALLAVTGIAEPDREPTLARARAAAEGDASRTLDGGALCVHDDRYPARLRDLTDPPRALFHTGPLERFVRLAAGRPVAVVGSRRPSAQALQTAQKLGRELAVAEVTVVSGLAFGIDAACHRGALEVGGGAIAVLASGADRVSPLGNRALYAELCAAGTVVSEMPWGAPPWRWLFPARNRIMAALSEITLVVEAAARSGSLITAEFATNLGRLVGAMPGAPGARLTDGNNGLIRDGCAAIRGAADVLDELHGVRPGADPQAETARRLVAGDPVLAKLLDAVEVGETLEQMGERSGLAARDLRVALARLEGTGLIRRAGLHGYVATTIG